MGLETRASELGSGAAGEAHGTMRDGGVEAEAVGEIAYHDARAKEESARRRPQRRGRALAGDRCRQMLQPTHAARPRTPLGVLQAPVG